MRKPADVGNENSEEVRREAYQAAASAVDRFLERIGDPAPSGLTDLGEAAWSRFRAELARVVDVNLDLVRNAFNLYGSMADSAVFPTDGSAGRLSLSPGLPGSESCGVVWLHNFDETPRVGVALVGSKLSASQGEPIDDPGWLFSPPTVDVPARSAVSVLAKVTVPPDTPSGVFEGTISATGLQGRPIDVRLEVIDVEPVAHETW
jgi:hypothetical protein